MFLVKLVLSPFTFAISTLQFVASAVIRALLVALVALAIMSQKGDASGHVTLDRGIDAVREKVLSVRKADLISASSRWYSWAKNQVGLVPDCPSKRI